MKCQTQMAISFCHSPKATTFSGVKLGRVNARNLADLREPTNFTDRRTSPDKYPEWDSNVAWKIILPACQGYSTTQSLLTLTKKSLSCRYKNSRSQCEAPAGPSEGHFKEPDGGFHDAPFKNRYVPSIAWCIRKNTTRSMLDRIVTRIVNRIFGYHRVFGFVFEEDKWFLGT